MNEDNNTMALPEYSTVNLHYYPYYSIYPTVWVNYGLGWIRKKGSQSWLKANRLSLLRLSGSQDLLTLVQNVSFYWGKVM